MATLTETQESSQTTIRNFQPGDEALMLEILDECYHNLEYSPRLSKEIFGPYLNKEGSFIAEKDGSAVGCVGLRNHPRPNWFEIRYLTVRDSSLLRPTAQQLVARVLAFADSKHAERLKALVPAIQPYVDLYKDAGFDPVRRLVRVSWDLTTSEGLRNTSEEIRELSNDVAREASTVWVDGLRPHWDWWIEEQGGPEAAGSWVKGSIEKHDNWLGAFDGGGLVGVTMVWPNFYSHREARFNGVYVLPEFRNHGVGSALMNAIREKAHDLDQRTMNVYTVAYMDHLAPGAVLYLKSGGRIEGEYLHMEKH